MGSSEKEYRKARIVAFGGGTGLPVLLRGLRGHVADLVAVVTVADDGGSSGRLRQELGVAPPGDVRNCLVALAGREQLAEVFNYRFAAGDLNNHTVGNIIIAALTDMSGDFSAGVEQAARFLRAKGRVYPAANESLTLEVTFADGTVVRGESAIHKQVKEIRAVRVLPEGAGAPAPVLEAISEADAVVLSSGSLFTSTIPSLLGCGVREAVAEFGGPVVYVANIMTQPGETTGFGLRDHLYEIRRHTGVAVTDVILDSGVLPRAVLERYASEGAAPVVNEAEGLRKAGVRVHGASVISTRALERSSVRHDPKRLAEEVRRVALVRR